MGVWNSVSLQIITKKQRFRSLSFSRVSPEVTADDVEKPLKPKEVGLHQT
jgi:hypothetical protein